jgi:O-antigen/teichoic acid export membrane protein
VSSIGRDVAANFVARAVVGLGTIAFTPAYVSILGIDAYGVIGTFAAFQAILYIFDFGMGLTLNRHLAQLATDERNSVQAMRDAVRTFEVVYWAVGAVLGLLIVVAASGVATSWFRPSGLSTSQISAALAMMGVALAIQWPSVLYLGGLLGLQRQVSASVISASAVLLRGGGAIAVLLFVAPTLEAFFAWQIVASLFQTSALRVRLSQVLPWSPSTGRFRFEAIRSNMRLAADLTAITVLGTLLIQLDKVILSRGVSLTDFGYYVLAGTIASSVNLFVSPVFNAAFPRLAAAAATNETDRARRTYHQGCQVMSLVIWPLALVLIAFAPEALHVWLGVIPSDATVWLVRILVAGTALNGLMNVPYALMLANGWSRLPLILNLVAVLVLAPLIVFMVIRFGTIGGALAWLLLNLGYVTFGIRAMHQRLLRGQAGTWYVSDVGLPLLGSLLPVTLIRLVSADGGRGEALVLLLFTGAIAVCGAALGSDFIRSIVRDRARGVPAAP